MTTDEYLRMPETVAPQELVYGFVREAPGPSPGHQSVVGELFVCLRAHLNEQGIGRVWMAPIDVVLDRDLVVQPDLIVVGNERLSIVRDRVWGAPDLVVEVMCPRPRIGPLEERLGWFAKYGVRECWLAMPDRRQLDVIGFANGAIEWRRRFGSHEVVESAVLRALNVTAQSLGI